MIVPPNIKPDKWTYLIELIIFLAISVMFAKPMYQALINPVCTSICENWSLSNLNLSVYWLFGIPILIFLSIFPIQYFYKGGDK